MDPNRHLGEDEIDKYSLRRIAEPDLERVENHLLVCPACREQVETSDKFAYAMQEAAAEIGPELETASPRWRLPRMLLVFAATALLLVGVFLAARKSPAPFAVALTTTRGAAVDGKAPAGTPLDLRLDVTGVPSFSAYKVQIVNQTGQTVWTGAFPGAAAPPAAAGNYFVRLYSPTGELLREYGLEIDSR